MRYSVGSGITSFLNAAESGKMLCGFCTAKLHSNINHGQAYPADSWRREPAPGCLVTARWAAAVRRHPRAAAAPRPQAPLPRSGSWALCCPASRHSTRRRTPCRQLESWTRSRFHEYPRQIQVSVYTCLSNLSGTAKETFLTVLRIHDILVWIRIRGFMPLTNGSGFGSGSCYFVIDLIAANKKLNFWSFSACYFLKVQLHHLSKIKSQKEVTKQ